ncbi:hypothetical protein PsorP6_014900 [Peronosclerospora sorghi]|uniref:Uncharacterized protein n=1 Tax=Peronosclerospora sorghi TaxID=230839 RepID=A0ACC0VTA8_9STRA|nr:hypothetical protein PsorP6_014900 [Peronosclerospora sorghi]
MEIMSARFLNDDDSDFVNYAEIDTNETLDDFVEIQREAEERYFWCADGADFFRWLTTPHDAAFLVDLDTGTGSYFVLVLSKHQL